MNADPRIVSDVLGTLVAHEIFKETEDGLFSLNEVSIMTRKKTFVFFMAAESSL